MNERDMLNAFWQQARVAVASVNSSQPHLIKVGPEFEFFMYKKWGGAIASDDEKQKLLGRLGSDYSQELGAAAIEYHPGPVILNETGFEGWYECCVRAMGYLQQHATEMGFSVGSCGTIPWVPTQNVARSDALRYQLLPDYHRDHRALWNNSPRIGKVSLADPGVVGLLNAFQFSIQADGLADGIDKLNRLFYISPMAVALAPNASTLGGQDTGWADARFEVWRRSFDTRSLVQKMLGRPLRIGLPNRYFKDVWDYFNEITSYPFILEDMSNALRIGIGAYWRDARLKFANGNVVVEFRPLSMQTGLAQNLGLACFVTGRLLWSQDTGEMLPPMRTVQRNKYQAEKYGKKAVFRTRRGTVRAKDLLIRDLNLSREGLRRYGILDCFAQEELRSLETKLYGE